MKRLSRATPGRILIALHVAALLAGCAVLEPPAPRYGSIKDDPVVVSEVARDAPRRIVRIAQRSGDWSPGATAKPAPKVEARPIKAASDDDDGPLRSAQPPVKVAQEQPSRTADSKDISRSGIAQAPPAPSATQPPTVAAGVPARLSAPAAEQPKKVQTNASSTTTTAEATEARAVPRPGPIDRPAAIERPGAIDRDADAPRTERPSAEARRSTPSKESVPPPAAEPKARPAVPAPSPEPKAAMAPPPPAAKPAPAPTVTPPAPPAVTPALPPAPSAATPPAAPWTTPKAPPPPVKGKQAPADKNGKQPQVPLGPADQLGAPGSIAAMIERSELLLRIGNVSEAREVLSPGVNSSSPEVITALAKTYDPNELKAFLVPPGTSDVTKAAQLYTEASRLGSLDARRRLERLRSPATETPPQPVQPAPALPAPPGQKK